MGYTRPAITRIIQTVALIVTAAVPLVCIPGWEVPFSLPKVVALIYWTGIGGLLVLIWPTRRPTPPGFLAGWLPLLGIAWIALVALSAISGAFSSPQHIMVEILPVGCFLIFLRVRPETRHAAISLLIPGILIATMAVLQRFNFDPFGWFNLTPALPHGASERMRVYATLGNPNYVAAYLCGVTPLWWASGKLIRRASHRWLNWLLAGPLLLLGIVVTGSRIPLLAGIAVVVWCLFLHKRRAIASLTVVVFLALVVFVSPGRPLGETVRGRLYIWEVVFPHLFEAPLLGFGPGSFEPKYAQWETALLETMPRSDERMRFRGYQNHAHNDYLEIMVEHGLAGLVAFMLIAAVGLAGALALKGSERLLGYGAAGGVVALLACAWADFPLHRPAESFLFWMLLAIVCLSGSTSRSSQGSAPAAAPALKEECV